LEGPCTNDQSIRSWQNGSVSQGGLSRCLRGPAKRERRPWPGRPSPTSGAPGHYATADEPVLKNRLWIEQQWETARFGARKEGRRSPGLLVLDEVQKIPGWSETFPAALRLSVLRVAGATGRGQPMGVFQGNPAGQGLARACQGLGVLLSSSRNDGRALRGHAEMFFSTGYRCSPG